MRKGLEKGSGSFPVAGEIIVADVDSVCVVGNMVAKQMGKVFRIPFEKLKNPIG